MFVLGYSDLIRTLEHRDPIEVDHGPVLDLVHGWTSVGDADVVGPGAELPSLAVLVHPAT